MRFKNLLKPFLITTLIMMIGFAGKAQLLSESFDNATFPPPGWTNVHVATATEPTSVWERATAGTFGGDLDPTAGTTFNVSPHSGAGMAEFRAWDFGSPTATGDAAYLASPSFSLVSAAPQQVSFWMHRDVTYTNSDSVSVYINTAQNLTGASFLGKVIRQLSQDPVETGANGWYRYSFAIPANFTGANNYIIMKVVSEWGNNVFIDDVTVADAACSGTPDAGTVLSGTPTVCIGSPTNLVLSGYSTGGGITLQWESSPAGANTFTAISGETTGSFSGAITDPTDFRVKVTCANGSAFAYSPITTVGVDPLPTNDEVCDAITLIADGASQCGNTTCATTALDEPDGGGCSTANNTVWYKFTPTVTANYNIVLTNADFATWIDIFNITGTCPSPTAYTVTTGCLTNVNADQTAFFDSVTLAAGSFTAGTDYYIRIDGYSGAFGSYCMAIVTAPPPPVCTSNIAPANAAVNVPGPVTFSWNATTGADGYTLIVGTDNPPVAAGDTLGTVAGTSVQLLGLNPSTTYSWYVVPFNSGGSATGCISNATTFTTAAAPANNACSAAINVPVTNSFCASPVLGDLTFADSAVGFTSPACQPGALPWDVWFKVTVPASGKVIVQTSAVNTDVTDLVMEAYAGSCTGALIDCNDDDNPDFTPSALHPRISLSGRTPGEIIYFRVMPYYDGTLTNVGAFAICAFDSSVIAPVAPASTSCAPVTLNIDSAFKYTWATFKDAGGNVIAQVYPNGNVFGNTSASYYVNSGAVRQIAGTFYLDRNVTVTPTNQPDSTVGVLTRVYFTDAELAALAAAAGGATPADLNCTKTSQTCATSAVVANGGEYFDQFDNGDYGANHFVTVLHDDYSTFYLHKGNVVLPVTLSSFTAVRAGSVNKLNWSTETEVNLSTFIVERGASTREFKQIGTVAAKGNSTSIINYNFTDASPAKALNYYRLKMVDNNGNVKYSDIRTVRNEGTADVTISPNPVKGSATLKVSSDVQDKAIVTINDFNGRIVYRTNASIAQGTNTIKLELAGLSAGTYVVKVQLNKDLVVTKFNKQ